MNKNVILSLLVILLIILSSFLTIRLYQERNKPIPINPGHTDTIYVKKPFTPLPEYKFLKVPYLVTFWSNPEVKVDTAYIDSSKIHYIISSGHVEFSHQFLINYPENPKLIQMLTKKDQLEFTFLNPRGLIKTEKYEFYPEVNYYNYQNSRLTYKRKSLFERFDVSPELMIRPVVNMYDLNLGLKYKTRKIYYEIGLNSYYYPTLGNKPIGVTPYIRVGLTL